MKKNLVLTGLLVLTLLATVVGCTTETPTPEPMDTEEPAPTEEPAEAETISVAGSTTVQPLAEMFAEGFAGVNPNVQIDVQGGGSSVGVKSAGEDTVDVGMASRKIKDSELEEFPELIVFTIAKDGIAICAHPDVEVDDLTVEQVREIFAGNITNWSEVGGPDTPITVISREEGSGTRGAFEEMVMGKDGPVIVDTAILFPSNGAVRTALADTPDSIGYLSFGYIDDTIKPLQIGGVEPTPANALSEDYPIVRPLNMMTNGEPSGVVKDWLDFIMSDDGQAIVEEEGYLPVSGAAAEPMEEEEEEVTISVAGSTTVQPLAELFAEAFTADMPNVQIDVQGGGSSVGVKSAGEATVDVGMASREIKDSELEEFPELNVFVVARDGIAIVVHPDVDVDELTLEQAREIFAGNITDFSEVGGSAAPITVISREEGSGTRGAFEEMVMGKEGPAITETALLFPSNGAVRTAVSETPSTIAFLSFGYLDDSVKPVNIDGAAPTPENAASGAYPVVRPLNMMTNGEPSGAIKDWLDFIVSEDGQAIVEEEGYLSILGGDGAEVPTGLSGSISVAGSTTVQPLAELFAEGFGAYNPDVQIDVQGGGSSVGVKSAGEATVDVGMASREIKDSELEEFPELNVFVVARDGIAIVVHPDVDVDELTLEQVREIFAGNITDFSEVGGSAAPITVISREEGSGTRGAFEEMVMGKEGPAITETALLFPSNGAVRTAVSETPSTIAFLSFGYLDDSVKPVSIDGAAPTPENAADGSYPVVRPLNMMTNGAPEGAVEAWLNYILSPEGQEIVADEGYLPLQ